MKSPRCCKAWITCLAALGVGVIAALWVAWLPEWTPLSDNIRTEAYELRTADGVPWVVNARSSTRGDIFRANGHVDQTHAEAAMAKFRASGSVDANVVLPSWSRLYSVCTESAAHLPELPPGGTPIVWEISRGWPLRSFAGTSWQVFDGMPNRPTFKQDLRSFRHSDVPTRPLPLGLVGDIAIFSAVAAALIPLLGVAVRALRAGLAKLRAREGVCPKCGYNRAGLAAHAKCPECGTVPAPASK